MSDREVKFELPGHIERYLATLSRLYAQTDMKVLQEIIVNSTIRIREGWDYDNWNGGTYGHALYLIIPETLYALMTKGFHDSPWTDQEVGVAFGRGVPIIPVKLGKDPYGFIGKFQAIVFMESCGE